MLDISRVLAFVVCLGLSVGSAQALSLADGAEPAEFPPSSYSGDLYIDSRGCVYIRAGFSGAVTWVPRVMRNRQVVCGQTPSLAPRPVEVAVAAEAAPTPVATPEPVPTPVATPAPARVSNPAPAPIVAPVVVPAPEPTPAPASANEITRTVAVSCPVGGSNRNVRVDGIKIPLRCEAGQVGVVTYIVQHRNGERTQVRVAAPEPVREVVASVPSPAPVPARVVVPTPTPIIVAPARISPPVSQASEMETVYITCPSRGEVSRAYTNDGRTIPVRCGPQMKDPVTYIVQHQNGDRTRVVASPPVRVARAIATPNASASASSATPEGYRPAWTDGRLNPNRGPQTQAGTARMNLIWTQTVPRKLIDTISGRVVTARFRGIKYPTMPSAAQIEAVAAGNTVRMAASAPTPATGQKFVQVALFGVPENAQKTAARLQGMGLPVSMGRLTRSGKPYQIVMAGPFTQTAKLNAALAQIRRAGFADAYIR